MALDTPLEQIESLYIGYFGRAGEPDGVDFWLGQLNSGSMSLAQIAASFSVQPEAKAEYAFLAHPELAGQNPGSIPAFITEVYQNLFHRAPDAEGLAFWTAELASRATDPAAIGQFILDVISGAYGEGGSAADQATLENKVEAAGYFTTQLSDAGIGGTHVDANGNVVLDDNVFQPAHSAVNNVTDDPATVTASEQATDAFLDQTAAVQDFTSATPETLLGTDGNDVFSGIVDRTNALDQGTYQTADSAQGGEGHDTMNLTVLNSNTAVLLHGQSVEEVSVTNFQNVTFDAHDMDSLEAVSLVNAGGSATFNGVQTNVTEVSITSPSVSNGTLGVHLDASIDAPEALTVDVNLKGAGNWTLDYDHSGGATFADDLITDLNIHAEANNGLTFNDSNVLSNLTVDGSGSLVIDLLNEVALTNVDASQLQGDFTVDNTVNLAHDLTFAGAQGDNSANFDTYDGAAHNLTVTSQGGDDDFYATMDDQGGTVSFDVGAGDNYVEVDDVGADANVTVTALGGDDDIDVDLDNQGGTVTIDAGDGGVIGDSQTVYVQDAGGATVGITTGAGVDYASITGLTGGATGTTLTASLGAGDDTADISGAIGDGTTIDGGDGDDTLRVNASDIDGGAGNDLDAAHITSIENLMVSGASANDIAFTDAAGFSNITFTNDTGHNITINELVAGATVAFQTDQTGALTLDGLTSAPDGALNISLASDFSPGGAVTVTDFGTVNFSLAGNGTDLDLTGTDTSIDAEIISFKNADADPTHAQATVTFDWSQAGDVVDSVTTLDFSGAANTLITGTLDTDLTHGVTINLGDFNAGSSITLDAAAAANADTLVFDDVTKDTGISVSQFQADDAAGHDILNLSNYNLASANLNFNDNGADTIISFEADGHNVDITLVGVTGVDSAELIAHNIVL
jgi:hypothetical protein